MQILTFSIKILLYALGAFSILLTILPFLRLDHWTIRIGEFPRVQIAILCVIVLVLFSFFYKNFASYDFVFAGLLIASALYQFYCIVPYTPVYPIQSEPNQQTKPEKIIKILIANVFIENRKTEPLLKLVERINPDVILLAEPDKYWVEKVSSLKETYPFAVEKPLDNAYGMALYSRLELIEPEIKFVVEDDVPSIHTNVRLPSGDIVRLYGVHPRPPSPTESETSTERDAELILVGKEIEKLDMPTIIAGDLNDVAWSRTTTLFQRISGMLDPRIGRGFYNSFHAEHWFMRFPLDHVFHTVDFRLVKIERLGYIGSDHFPIYIELSLEPSAEKTQEEPEANGRDKEIANEMVEQAEEKEGKDLGNRP